MNLCINRFFLCCLFLLTAACADELSEAERFQKICQAGGCDSGGAIDGAADSVADVSFTEVDTDTKTDASSDTDTEPDLSFTDSVDEVSDTDASEDGDIAEEADGFDGDDLSDTSGDSDVAEDTADVVIDIDFSFDTELEEPEELPDTTSDTEDDESTEPDIPDDTQIVDVDTSDQEVNVDEDGLSDVFEVVQDVLEETEEDATELAEVGSDVEVDVNTGTDTTDTDVAPVEVNIVEEIDVLVDSGMSDMSDGSDVIKDSVDVVFDMDLGLDIGSDIPKEVDVLIDAIADISPDVSETDGSGGVVDTSKDMEGDMQSDTSDTVGDVVLPPKCLSNEGCEDGNSCTNNTCVPETGCVSLPNQVTCSDNNACTENDLCKESVCVTGKPPACDDQNPCTVDYCDPTAGCVHVSVPVSCSDNNACTENDACQGSVCVGTPKNCNDGNACTEDTCSGGMCSSAAVPAGYGCGSSSLCKNSVCTAVSVPNGMVLVPAGEVWVGCNDSVDAECQADELPYTKVFVDPFFAQKQEVVHGQYLACNAQGKCSAMPNKYGCSWYEGIPGWPANCLSWNQAEAYCSWAGLRLPTEVEWQKAARGGCDKYPNKDCKAVSQKFPWGNSLTACKEAIIAACGGGSPKEVPTALLGLSPYGLEDMAGNVAEWTSSWYGAYTGMSLSNPPGPAQGTKKVVMGGSYSSSSADVRVSHRASEDPTVWNQQIGFRCVKTVTF